MVKTFRIFCTSYYRLDLTRAYFWEMRLLFFFLFLYTDCNKVGLIFTVISHINFFLDL